MKGAWAETPINKCGNYVLCASQIVDVYHVGFEHGGNAVGTVTFQKVPVLVVQRKMFFQVDYN